MYEYLKEHAYISKNKKSNYQFELTRERAECIANKYNSLCEEKDTEIEKLNAEINELDYLLLKHYERPYAKKWLEEQREKYKKGHLNIDTELGYPDSETIYKEYYKLNNIINKAIEYIEQPDNIQSVAFCKEDEEIMNLYKIDGVKSLELLEILKGSDEK